MRRTGGAGFTLIELMIVIVIVGVVLKMTIPAMAKFVNSSRLVGARNTLMSDLRMADGLAKSQRRSYELRLDTLSYKVVCLSPVSTVLTRSLPTGIKITQRDTASFFPWGLTETMAITLSRKDGNGTSVVRTTAAGQVTHD
jgi:prepilin-type N-terminal cleavage/methylation domain-containing protein